MMMRLRGERNTTVRIALWLLLLCPAAYAAACPAGQAKDEATVIQIEQTWARSLETQDISALMCILADEFEDAGPTGILADKKEILRRADNHKSPHHELSEMHAHVNGDVAYIRGVAATVAEHGLANKIRFTDIYVYRDGRWQCVAAQESSSPRPTTW
jgi:ketosteroid isomerase-like protein